MNISLMGEIILQGFVLLHPKLCLYVQYLLHLGVCELVSWLPMLQTGLHLEAKPSGTLDPLVSTSKHWNVRLSHGCSHRASSHPSYAAAP